MKKILAIVLALAMVIVPMTFSVSADAAATLTLGADTTVEAGEAIAIPVSISGDVAGAQFVVALGDLEYVGCSADAESFVYNADTNTIKFVDADLDGMTDLFTINATVPEDAEAGATYALAASDLVICDIDEALIDTAVVAGTYTVGSSHVHSYTYSYAVVGANCVTTATCECGDVQTVATVANPKFGHAPVLESDLTINFRLDTVLVTPYTDVEAVFTKSVYDGTEPVVTNLTYNTYSSTKVQFTYSGVKAKEMTSNINVQVFGTNADGARVLLASEDYSMYAYIQAAYNSYKNATAGSKNAAMRQLIVDLANYGAAAQTYFNYNTANLANKDIPQTYASATITNFASFNATSGITISKAPDLQSKVLVNLRINKSDVTSAAVVEIDYTSTDGSAHKKTVPYAEFTDYSSTRWQVVFDAMTAATLSSPFTVTVKDGATVKGTMTYSMEDYAGTVDASSAAAYATLKPLTNALIRYGRSASAYFNYGK